MKYDLCSTNRTREGKREREGDGGIRREIIKIGGRVGRTKKKRRERERQNMNFENIPSISTGERKKNEVGNRRKNRTKEMLDYEVKRTGKKMGSRRKRRKRKQRRKMVNEGEDLMRRNSVSYSTAYLALWSIKTFDRICGQ